MLLTLSTTHAPATDLGFLLAKHPARTQSFSLAFGEAHVFFPEATEARCTAALFVDVDPVGLVRGRRPGDPAAQRSYVNDRPFAASSMLSVAIAQVFGSAYAGRCRERPELATTPIPLEATLPTVPCRGGEGLLRRLFEPLGWHVDATRLPLDPAFPAWGDSPYFTVSLKGTARLSELLAHLYVLVPVLDDDKHYWVGDDEVEKLVRKGEGWLATHPEKEAIAHRYLKRRRGLAKNALERLATPVDEGALDDDDDVAPPGAVEDEAEAKVGLDTQRITAVHAALVELGATSVVDLGCGDGKLLRKLLHDDRFERVAGMDVSLRTLDVAEDRLRLDRLPERKRTRIQLLHGSLVYRDARIAGFDAAALVEVIEHVDPSRLSAVERTVFGFARPRIVIVTTPNVEYNARFAGLPAGKLRHGDHRFEWTRAELRAWADAVATRRGYGVSYAGIGDEDPTLGAPTQMAIFVRSGT